MPKETHPSVGGTNPDVYPVTHAFEKANLPKTREREHLNHYLTIQRLYTCMAGNLGEYEHGSVDIEDVFDDLVDTIRHTQDPKEFWRAGIKMYAAVAQDILDTVISTLVDDL